MKIEHWEGLTPYGEGVARMEAILAEVLAGEAERIVFCEHEAVLTVGTSGSMADIGDGVGVPVVETGRGGKVTYHGPGQRVVYLIVNLKRWDSDVRVYVKWLQGWLIDALRDLGTRNQKPETEGIRAWAGEKDEIGVWVGDRKIAAIGVRVRKGVAYHGVALNVTNDLAIYERFVPCGIIDKGVTSLMHEAQGTRHEVSMADVDAALARVLRRMMPLPR